VVEMQMQQEKLIKLQQDIIKKPYETLHYINFELMNFAWSTNDFAVDTLRKVAPLLEQLNFIESNND
jgi:hypothetical protein